ncbi:hypothetical protein [Pseudomonas lurida]|uniref:hypothetical protein n=1 Tax=Pseudomonas lurida TaxID=244566 RepID=UPI00177F82C5|nr:hypothetical protein [Pseudomonas lurida]MBD8671598.1 hypothetical protein [Pseudomonas lurida]
MSLFLQRPDFEQACADAGITDLARDGEGYANPATQATYLVWLSVARPTTGRDSVPIGWVTRRGGRVHSFSYTRPAGPGSSGWAVKQRQGWNAPMPVYPNVPSASTSAMAVIMENLRQLEEKGYSLERDRAYTSCELERAAACYAFQAAGLQPFPFARFWPWPHHPMKKCNATEALTKAGALVLAAMERKTTETAA